MNSTYYIIIVVAVLVIAGIILAPLFARRRRSQNLRTKFGTEYDHTLQVTGDEKKARTELEERQKRVKSLNILPLSASDRECYMAEWSAIQSNFVDVPGQAVLDADRLIMEVMQLRAYPLSDFEQRAADISVMYPNLVSNYRAARVIAIKNEQQLADTEELRQAMIFYRSLFEELLGKDTEVNLGEE